MANNYLNELSLKKEIVLINNSSKMKEDKTIEPYDNTEKIDDIIKTYNKETYNIKKGIIHEEFIQEINKCFIPDYSKEEFGRQLLQLIKNIGRKSCFGGYSNNWKNDFEIDAIEKVLKYLHNFNPNKISERSGERVKAFAYLTQIISQAFISVINKKNDEKKKNENYDIISYTSMSDSNIMKALYNQDNESEYTLNQEKIEYEEYEALNTNEIYEIINKALQEEKDEYNIRILFNTTLSLDDYNKIIEIKPDNMQLIIEHTKEDKDDKENEW